jgi:hypothetical protein
MLPLLLALTVSAGYARSELPVETDWLAAHMTDPGIRVVDMRASE